MEFFPQNIITFKNYIIENFGIHYPIEIVVLIIQIATRGCLIIDVSGTNKLNVLFKFVYSSKIVDSVLFNGVPYYQHTSPWSCCYTHPSIRPSYDPDIRCKGFVSGDDCDCAPSIYPNRNDKVEYVTDDVYIFALNDPYYVFLQELCKYDSQHIFLIGYNEMKICNDTGYHYNRKGSDHCRIYLEYYNYVIINGWTTLNKFIEACYKIKSHKFDSAYEVFHRTTIIKNKKDLCVKVTFKHNPYSPI